MGWTVLYLAFGLVALWLLGEVLLQYKARLRWRLLAFFGFLVVVIGVVLPSVAVIAAGAAAFAVGQTLVTLSFRKGFATGWALGGGPGTSRRRRSEVRPMEPLDDTGELEVYQEYPGEGYGYGYDRDDSHAPDLGYTSGPDPDPGQPAGTPGAPAPDPHGPAGGGDRGYQPTEQYQAVGYDYPSPAGTPSPAGPAAGGESDRFAYAETTAYPGFATAPGGYAGYPDPAGGSAPSHGGYADAPNHEYGATPVSDYATAQGTEYGVPYGAAPGYGTVPPQYGTEPPQYGATPAYGYAPDPSGQHGFPAAGDHTAQSGWADYGAYDGHGSYPGYAAPTADPYGAYDGGGGWSTPAPAGYPDTPPGGVWMPQQRDGGTPDGYDYPPPATRHAQGYYGDGHRY